MAVTVVVCLPTTIAPAPPVGQRGSERHTLRLRNSALTSIAGNTGRPQISLPLAEVGGLPVGLSLLGDYGADRATDRVGAGDRPIPRMIVALDMIAMLDAVCAGVRSAKPKLKILSWIRIVSSLPSGAGTNAYKRIGDRLIRAPSLRPKMVS